MRGQLASAVRLLGSFSLANMPIKQPGAEKNARNMFKGQPPPKKTQKTLQFNHTCEDCRCPLYCLCIQIWDKDLKPCFPMVLHVKLTSRLQELHKTVSYRRSQDTLSPTHFMWRGREDQYVNTTKPRRWLPHGTTR